MSSFTGARTSSNKGGYNSFSGSSPKGYDVSQLQNFTPEMMNLFKSLFSHVGPGSYTSRLAAGDEDLFNEIEAPAYTKLTSNLGGLASKFSGMGTGGRHSSGFQNTASQTVSEFGQGLQAKRMGLQQQALKDLFGMSGDLLNQRPYENVVTPKSDFLSQLFGFGGDMAEIFAKIAPFLI